MQLLFDLSAFEVSSSLRFHGAAEYARSLLRAILARANSEAVGLLRIEGLSIDGDVLGEVEKSRCRLFTVPGDGVQSLIDREAPAVFYTGEGLRFRGLNFGKKTKFVCTIHGLRSFEVPADDFEKFYDSTFSGMATRAWRRVRLSRATSKKRNDYAELFGKLDSLFVPSLHTKYYLQAQFPNHAVLSGAHVFYSPERLAYGENAHLAEVGVGSHFLIVSAGRWVKNARRAIEALDQIYAHNPNLGIDTVVLGVGDKNSLLAGISNMKRFRCEGYVTENQLDVFYRNAFALVYPTLSEGFGYPPLEAMRYGVPVACSNAASLTEICGDAPVYFSPKSVDEIRARILSLILEPGLRDACAVRSRKVYTSVSERQKTDLEKMSRLLLGELKL